MEEKQKHIEAKALYLGGTQIKEIAKLFKTTQSRVQDWKNKHGWEEELKEQKKQLNEKLGGEIAKLKELLIKGAGKLFQMTLLDIMKRIEAGTYRPTIDELKKLSSIILETTSERDTIIIQAPSDVIDTAKLLQIVEEGKENAKIGTTGISDKEQEGKTTD